MQPPQRCKETRRVVDVDKINQRVEANCRDRDKYSGNIQDLSFMLV